MNKHGKTEIVAGPLRGSTYDAIPEERLKKAAKRYTGDPAFQKYARSYMLLLEMCPENEPQPCAPIVLARDEKTGTITWFAWLVGLCEKLGLDKWLSLRRWRWIFILLLITFVLLLKPAVSATLAKMLGTGVRLFLRRVFIFWSIVLENVMDEISYQLDFMVKEALPFTAEMPEGSQTPGHWASHLFSAGFGVVLTLLHLRRGQVQA